MFRRRWVAALAAAGLGMLSGCSSMCIGNGQLLDRFHCRSSCPCQGSLTSMSSAPEGCCDGAPLMGGRIGPEMMGSGPVMTGPPPAGLPMIPSANVPPPMPLPTTPEAPPSVAGPTSKVKQTN